MTAVEKWPGGARCAALLTINLDADQFWLGMFPESITRPKTLSMGEYGIKRGLDRVLFTLRQYQVQTTFFVPGLVAQNYPEAIEKILADGHELALHGHTHTGMAQLDREKQRAELRLGKEALRRLSGVDPIGFRAPEGELTLETLELVREEGFLLSLIHIFHKKILLYEWFVNG